jgi:hypothetical protein
MTTPQEIASQVIDGTHFHDRESLAREIQEYANSFALKVLENAAKRVYRPYGEESIMGINIDSIMDIKNIEI